MPVTGRFALGLGAFNLAALILIAAGSAKERPAPVVPADALPLSRVAARLEGDTVTRILSIAAEDGAYRVTAIDRSGREVSFAVDAHTARPLL
ncbi:MAG TPA: hypothetical protein VEB20_03600 [Azospirillaceae bacterium]|nr:hypothetical protein [Azospirillaceae bacterium]